MHTLPIYIYIYVYLFIIILVGFYLLFYFFCGSCVSCFLCNFHSRICKERCNISQHHQVLRWVFEHTPRRPGWPMHHPLRKTRITRRSRKNPRFRPWHDQAMSSYVKLLRNGGWYSSFFKTGEGDPRLNGICRKFLMQGSGWFTHYVLEVKSLKSEYSETMPLKLWQMTRWFLSGWTCPSHRYSQYFEYSSICHAEFISPMPNRPGSTNTCRRSIRFLAMWGACGFSVFLFNLFRTLEAFAFTVPIFYDAIVWRMIDDSPLSSSDRNRWDPGRYPGWVWSQVGWL